MASLGRPHCSMSWKICGRKNRQARGAARGDYVDQCEVDKRPEGLLSILIGYLIRIGRGQTTLYSQIMIIIAHQIASLMWGERPAHLQGLLPLASLVACRDCGIGDGRVRPNPERGDGEKYTSDTS